MSMSIELHVFKPSVPCRMVCLLMEHLELDVDVKDVDILNGAQFADEYIQMNPQHTVPTLVDDGLIINESRAILMYLGNKYKKDDTLYPTEPEKRAVVDTRLCFDLSTLYPRFVEAYFPVMFAKMPQDPAKVEKLDEALGYVVQFLKDGYMAGSEMTIADFSVSTILSTIQACGHDLSGFEEITAYLEQCGAMKGWEANQTGADMFGEMFKSALAEISG